MYAENLPSRLKFAREKIAMSQTEVAKEIGINRSTLAKYELGQREPDIEMLVQLSIFYNVSLDWLVGIGKAKNREEIIEDFNESKERTKILKDLEKEAKKQKIAT